MAKSQPKCNAANACSHIPRAERAETHENIQLKFFEWSEKAPSYFVPVTTRKHAGPASWNCGTSHLWTWPLFIVLLNWNYELKISEKASFCCTMLTNAFACCLVAFLPFVLPDSRFPHNRERIPGFWAITHNQRMIYCWVKAKRNTIHAMSKLTPVFCLAWKAVKLQTEIIESVS